MKIVLVSIGKPHEASFREGINEYTDRLKKYYPTEWQILPPVKNAAVLSEEALKLQEAKLVDNFLSDDDYLILLDERGKNISSPDLANVIQIQANASTKRIVFLIGGAFGVDTTIMRRANYTWSLSKLVFPHMLVRLILAEQLYRASTIIRGEKYHHV